MLIKFGIDLANVLFPVMLSNIGTLFARGSKLLIFPVMLIKFGIDLACALDLDSSQLCKQILARSLHGHYDNDFHYQEGKKDKKCPLRIGQKMTAL